MSRNAPYYDKRSERWVVVERLSKDRVDHHKFADEKEAWEFSGHDKEDQMGNDVTHLGAVGLDVIPLALSERACDHLLELLDYDFGSGDEGTDAALSEKIRDELRIARDATLSKREQSGITDEVRKAAGARTLPDVRQDRDFEGPPAETEAKRIAGKMATAAKEAVEE